MSLSNNHAEIDGHVRMFQDFDERRQRYIEELAVEFKEALAALNIVRSDLEDERATKRNYKKRAEDAEEAINRSQFVLVLVDGDGYIFKPEYLKADAGGAKAAHDLISEVHQHCRASGIMPASGNMDVMINVYANKTGLAKTLYSADMISWPEQLDLFWSSFNQSHALAHFIDCGYGKERADSKIRGKFHHQSGVVIRTLTFPRTDTYRFYAQNPGCCKVLLALCHDNGYAAELDKYRHDPIIAPKTILVQPPTLNQMPRAYVGLPFSIVKMNCFETTPIDIKARPNNHQQPPPNGVNPEINTTMAQRLKPTAEPFIVSHVPDQTPATRTAAPPPASVVASPTPPKAEVTKAKPPPPVEPILDNGVSHPNSGIPVNRAGQRVDKKMTNPSQLELARFDARIKNGKLCNVHHLRDSCYQYNCKYDHDDIDSKMVHTLRYKARSIPCATGMRCRRIDCYYGHHCPWMPNDCSNPQCNFLKKGLHSVSDLQIVKYAIPEA